MSDVARYVMAPIEWVLVPLILVILFLSGITLRPKDPSLKTSTIAGKLAGFVLFVLFVVSQKGHPMGISFTLPDYGVEWLPLLSSIVLLFLFARVLEKLLRTRLAGIVAMFLVAAPLITLHAYVFLAPYRSTIVYLALGGTLGALFEMLLFERDPVSTRTHSTQKEQPR